MREVKELHARALKPLLANPKARERVLMAAAVIAAEQAAAREGQGAMISAAQVTARLKSAGQGPSRPAECVSRQVSGESGVSVRRKSGKVTLEFSEALSTEALRAAFDRFLAERRE